MSLVYGFYVKKAVFKKLSLGMVLRMCAHIYHTWVFAPINVYLEAHELTNQRNRSLVGCDETKASRCLVEFTLTLREK